jgi:hypothetical protein
MICSKAVWKHTFVNPVRAVDVFVDALELRELGFDGVDPAATPCSPKRQWTGSKANWSCQSKVASGRYFC